MNDYLLRELLDIARDQKDDLSKENLIKANTKLIDENAIIKKELKKYYNIIDQITDYIEHLEKRTLETKEIYRIITGEEEWYTL